MLKGNTLQFIQHCLKVRPPGLLCGPVVRSGTPNTGCLGSIPYQGTRSHMWTPNQEFACHNERSLVLQTRPGTAKLKEKKSSVTSDLTSWMVSQIIVDRKPPSTPENSARLHSEEMLGNLPSAISKFTAYDFTPVNVTTQVFTEENNALYCKQKPTD